MTTTLRLSMLGFFLSFYTFTVISGAMGGQEDVRSRETGQRLEIGAKFLYMDGRIYWHERDHVYSVGRSLDQRRVTADFRPSRNLGGWPLSFSGRSEGIIVLHSYLSSTFPVGFTIDYTQEVVSHHGLLPIPMRTPRVDEPAIIGEFAYLRSSLTPEPLIHLVGVSSLERGDSVLYDLLLSKQKVYLALSDGKRVAIWRHPIDPLGHSLLGNPLTYESNTPTLLEPKSAWERTHSIDLDEQTESLMLIEFVEGVIVLLTDGWLMEFERPETLSAGDVEAPVYIRDLMTGVPGHEARDQIQLLGSGNSKPSAVYQHGAEMVIHDIDSDVLYLAGRDSIQSLAFSHTNPRRVLRYVDALPPHIEPLFEAAIGYRDQGTGEQP